MTSTTSTPAVATITVQPHSEIGRIADEVYGHFLESAFFGNVEGGVFDEGSPLALPGPGAREGLRSDVIALCRALGVPVVRWPGGNFTSPYHWEDGVGPRDRRPRRLELAWGSEETNRFGTDEFLAWCAEVGAQAYLAHSARDVDEAVRWVEYTNYGGDTAYSRLRRQNGHPDPYRVRYWGIGNEVYGRWQMGHRTAEAHARDAREHAVFMRQVDPGIRTVGVGQPHAEEWTDALLRHAGRYLDHVSIHLYGASTHLVGGDEFDAVVAQAVFFEAELTAYADLVSELASRHGLDRPPSLALDEWNVRHLEPAGWPDPQPGDDGGIAARDTQPMELDSAARVNRWSPRTLADALCYAGVFHAIHRLAGHDVPVAMANPVNLVNANGIVVARPEGAFGSAVYGVYDLYQNHTGRIAVRAEVDGPSRSAAVRQGHRYDRHGALTTRPGTVPDLDVSATLTEDRRTLYLAVINRHGDRPVRTTLTLPDRLAHGLATVHQLGLADGDDDLMAGNALSRPDRVALREVRGATLDHGAYTFPAHTVTVLAMPLG
nr:alpha-L-arabinofuranosidase C-terminal domain-containing protein [uncultured Friedmanniella sp.]